MINPQVVAFSPAQLLQRLHECCNVGLPFGIASVGGGATEYGNAPYALTLLCVGNERANCCAANQRDKFSPLMLTLSRRHSNNLTLGIGGAHECPLWVISGHSWMFA